MPRETWDGGHGQFHMVGNPRCTVRVVDNEILGFIDGEQVYIYTTSGVHGHKIGIVMQEVEERLPLFPPNTPAVTGETP